MTRRRATPGANRINLDWSDNPIVHWEWTGTEYIRFNGDTPHNWLSAPVEGEDQVETQISTDTLVVLEATKYWASSKQRRRFGSPRSPHRRDGHCLCVL